MMSAKHDTKLLADINCDMGEGVGNEADLMPFISSANIACGYHAGDANTMHATVELAVQYGVAIGAHPSFHDRENFGRTAMQLEPAEVYDLVSQQLYILNETVGGFGTVMKHVKPHGALYNMSAKDTVLAAAIARAIKDFDAQLILFGLSGSCSISTAKELGLQTAEEVFADRTYRDDGSLTPRSQPGAMIATAAEAVKQVLQMVNEKMVTTTSGKIIPVSADTICIHGDGAHAIEFAKAVYTAILKQ
jgi:UPF0271 protein